MKLFPSSKYLQAVSNGLSQITRYLYQGFRHGLGLAHVKRCASLFSTYMNHFANALREESNDLGDLNGKCKQKLKQTTQGLHALLPKEDRYTYSILIPITTHINAAFLRKTLKSALDLTAPTMEILVGLCGTPPKELRQLIAEFTSLSPEKIKEITFNPVPENEEITAILNQLAANASGHYLLLLEPHDWVRPDLLYRYEQTLRLLPSPDNTVLYCNEYQINEHDYPIPLTHINKPERPSFPYLFADDIGHGLLIPKALWSKTGGLRHGYDGFEIFDIKLRLDLAGASYFNVPFYLYAHRSSANKSGAQPELGMRALNDYAKAKGLDWNITSGYLPDLYRAIPRLTHTPNVHIIIPYKDQKELTLRAANSALKQKNVNVYITAVNNNSSDLSIAIELKGLGIEVLTVREPFNYSRLNNLAVQRTTIGQECDYLLFLNNDVDLEEDALEEMCRWIDQPQIGMVGCRLHYPGGALQHGGVELSAFSPITRMTWEHVERFRSFEAMQITKQIRVTKALTAACALIKRQTFIDIDGFNEIWYPIAYSDTNLAMKLAARGLWCLYTPYASGIHNESASREYHNIEDYENSTWLHHKFFS